MSTLARIGMAVLVAAGVPSMAASPGATTQPWGAVDAADLYGRAAEGTFAVDSPASTSEVFPEFTPSSARWIKLETAAFAADAGARALARQARSANTLNWPPSMNGDYYNRLRILGDHLGDAAVYLNTRGRDAEAIETIRDLKYLRDVLWVPGDQSILRSFVAVGMKAQAMNRLEIIASGVALTSDPQNTPDLQAKSARAFVEELVKQPPPAELPPQVTTVNRDQYLEIMRRVWAEEQLAAMSLACHVFKFDKGRWPASLEEMIPLDLPRAIVDPWGDGKQALGYALIKGGSPDGSDRPLVYSRCYAPDGLAYPANRAKYSFYNDDGTDRISGKEQPFGQFRDVTRWEPVAGYSGPADVPLPVEMQSRVGAKV